MPTVLLALCVASLHALDSARKTGVMVHSNGKLTTYGGSPEPLVTCTAARPQGIRQHYGSDCFVAASLQLLFASRDTCEVLLAPDDRAPAAVHLREFAA